MKYRIITIAAMLLMVAMTGIAAADPARIDIQPDDDSNPLPHSLAGNTESYPVKVYEMIPFSSTETRYIEIRASSDLTLARLSGNGVDITAAGGLSASATYTVPVNTTEQMFTLEVKTSTPGEVTIMTNRGTRLFDPSVAPQDIGAASSSFKPEISKVALTIAACIGLVFFFQQKKNRKNKTAEH